MLANSGRGEVKRARDFLVFHFPHYQGSDGPQSALLKGSTKLIRFLEDDHVELYDLAKDVGESSNLADTQQAQAKQLNRNSQLISQRSMLRCPPSTPTMIPTLRRLPERADATQQETQPLRIVRRRAVVA
ncbi:MAG UNVERIFIED_CONTAM: hypothetical protein LVR18_07605 [Planctomycetaceae bacterium]